MADDINLPNLVSHLAVNLDGLQGTVADASRQGSSVGAALGGGIQRELQGLLAHLPDIPVTADSDQVDRDLARVRAQFEELSRQRIGIDIPVDQAIRQINELTPHLQRLSDTHPNISVQAATRQAAAQLDGLLAAAHRVDDVDPVVRVDVDVDEERPRRLLGVLGSLAGAGARAGAGIAASMASASAALGAAVPAAASVVTTLANVAPAAGVAVTGLAAVKLAQGAVQLAAVGMDEALGAALDPSKAEEFNEALEKLSPNARKFATAVRDAGPALREVQQSVQDRVFAGLDEVLRGMAEHTLPILRNGLTNTGGAINLMAKNVGNAAIGLSKSGTLGRAISSANIGLYSLARIPGQVAVALGQIAAAAGPSFERLTAAAGRAAEGISERLSDAYHSGAMQDAIERAVDLLGQLADVGGNVASIIGGIFNAVPAGGGGLIGVLQDVTGAIAGIVNTEGVQAGLRALFETIGTLGATAGPLLAQALGAIGPVLAALGPPAQTLIEALGAGLTPIITALGPVLVSAAGAVGALVEAAAPLLPVVGELAASLLPALTPLLDACTTVFQALAPVVNQTATILQESLSPILASLPGIIEPLAQMLADRLVFFLQLLGEVLVAVAPSLVTLGESAGQLLVATAPLITAVASLATQLLTGLMPVLQPLIGLVGGLATVLTTVLAAAISKIVIPVIGVVTKLLTGDFSGAWRLAQAGVQAAGRVIGDVATAVGRRVGEGVAAAVGWLRGLPSRGAAALSGLSGALSGMARAGGASMVAAISGKIAEAVGYVRGLPSRAAGALGGLGGVLAGAGRSLIQGFISGIVSQIGSVRSTLQGLTSKLTDWKGPKAKDAKILTPAGRLLIEGFIKGIDGTTAQLRAKLEAITKALPANVRSGIGKTLKRATLELERLVTKHDRVVDALAAAQKRLTELNKARAKAAADITSGILSEANITSGHADVNSVGAITVELQQALKATKAFQANIEQLREAGLRSDLLQQIADAGVAAGGATAAALARATPAELARINSLQAQLAKSATATGDTVGDALYGAGIRAAQGLVAGLKKEESAIERQMRKIALGMIDAVKDVHQTKSPSRAFRALGEMDMRGLEGGVLAFAGRAVAAVRRVAADMLGATSGLGGALTAAVPSGGQLAAVYAGGAGGGGDTYEINMYGTAATPAELVRELSWRGLVGRR